MAICPKGKVSKARRDKRRAHTWKITMPTLSTCKKCGELRAAHRVCKACGSYNRRVIIEVN